MMMMMMMMMAYFELSDGPDRPPGTLPFWLCSALHRCVAIATDASTSSSPRCIRGR